MVAGIAPTVVGVAVTGVVPGARIVDRRPLLLKARRVNLACGIVCHIC